jgi:glycosyltransferase involved in cell wall biosynthesis
MSVNLANALAQGGIDSYLCITRENGLLQSEVSRNVKVIQLDKKSAFDIKAILKLRRFIKDNHINIIHAHATSFFTATICKIMCSGIKVVWHDHYGNAEKLDQRDARVLKICSLLFDYVISVNEKLKYWAIKNLHLTDENITFIQNFANLSITGKKPSLPGDNEHRIIVLANLRPQKDHLVLLEAFNQIVDKYTSWHLLLVGADNNDKYSKSLKDYVYKNKLQDKVHFLGSRNDSADILKVSTIGMLSSESEGLPVALLEYGLAKLPVVCTDVGKCRDVLDDGKCGILVQPKDSQALYNALSKYIDDEQLRSKDALKYHHRVITNYSQEAVIQKIIDIYNRVINE